MANQVCVLRFTAPDPSFGPCNPWNYADRSRLGAASVIAEPGTTWSNGPGSLPPMPHPATDSAAQRRRPQRPPYSAPATALRGWIQGAYQEIATAWHSPRTGCSGCISRSDPRVRVDVIVTPDWIVPATDPRPSQGIIWDDLDQAKIAAIPALARLVSRH